MSLNILGNYIEEDDTKALARIDEILARSRKVVEESMELSKKSIEQKIKIDTALETSQSTENSFLYPRRLNSKILEMSESHEIDSSLNSNYERALSEMNSKITALEKKAEDDEKLLESLKDKVRAKNNKSPSKLEYEIMQADKMIQNLKEMLSIGLLEENKNLKADLESLLKKKAFEEARLNKELEDVIKEKKTLENQYNNLRYLCGNSGNYLEELQDAKIQLEKLDQESRETIDLLEKKIREQENENLRLKDMVKAAKEPEKLNIVKLKSHDQGKQSSSALKNVKK